MLNENCADLENESNEVPDSSNHSQTQEFDVSTLFYTVITVDSVLLVISMTDTAER